MIVLLMLLMIACNKNFEIENKTYIYEYSSIEKTKKSNSCPKYVITENLVTFYDCENLKKEYRFSYKDNILILSSLLRDETIVLKKDGNYLIYTAEFDVVAMDKIFVYYKEQ